MYGLYTSLDIDIPPSAVILISPCALSYSVPPHTVFRRQPAISGDKFINFNYASCPYSRYRPECCLFFIHFIFSSRTAPSECVLILCYRCILQLSNAMNDWLARQERVVDSMISSRFDPFESNKNFSSGMIGSLRLLYNQL